MKKLEDLRCDDLGGMRAWVRIPDSGSRVMTPFTFPEFCIKAFYLSCQSIEQLESSKGIINHGPSSILSAGMWFIAIEAFVNSILRVVCRITNNCFEDYAGGDISARIRNLTEMLGIDRMPLNRSGISSRLQDFKMFRNKLFHDTVSEKSILFRYTKFASVPNSANQVDVLQSSVIALEIFHAFRYVLPGVDLMPDIYIEKQGSCGYIKLDVFFECFLKKYFISVLKKHSLSTNFKLDPVLICLDETSLISKGDVVIIIKAFQEDQFKSFPDDSDTTIGKDMMAEFKKCIILDASSEFRMPNYFRK